MKAVKPVMLLYDLDAMVSPAYDTIELLPLAIFQLSYGCLSCKVVELPDFMPNDYLFETHADKGNEKWEIYAWAVREIFLKESGLEKCDIHLRDKVIFEGFMQHNKKYEQKLIELEAK